MYMNVREWIAICDECATQKSNQNKNAELIQTIKVSRPFQIVKTE